MRWFAIFIFDLYHNLLCAGISLNFSWFSNNLPQKKLKFSVKTVILLRHSSCNNGYFLECNPSTRRPVQSKISENKSQKLNLRVFHNNQYETQDVFINIDRTRMMYKNCYTKTVVRCQLSLCLCFMYIYVCFMCLQVGSKALWN